MRVVDTKRIYAIRKRQVKRRRIARRGFVALLVIVALTGVIYFAYQRPLPQASAKVVAIASVAGKKPVVKWPNYGQSAIGTLDYGLLDESSDQKPLPTASVAKVITALAVLKKKPLAKGQSGPVITITDEDVESYNYYASHDGSLVNVIKGEEITEYQALQALLLPSANNIAETLARWAFGSLDAYNIYANSLVAQLNMSKTHVADASGFSPLTVSTASDLVKLAVVALKDPVLAEIVSQQEAVVPVAGRITNTNPILGQSEIIGIKTGHTSEAGGCYLFATRHDFKNGHSQIVVGAIMAAPSLGQSVADSLPLLSSVYQGFSFVDLIKSGQVIADYTFPWGSTNQAIASSDVRVFAWGGENLRIVPSPDSLSYSQPKGFRLGNISASSKIDRSSTDINSKSNSSGPSIQWRLSHVY